MSAATVTADTTATAVVTTTANATATADARAFDAFLQNKHQFIFRLKLIKKIAVYTQNDKMTK